MALAAGQGNQKAAKTRKTEFLIMDNGLSAG
jgi:hypothetical protein